MSKKTSSRIHYTPLSFRRGVGGEAVPTRRHPILYKVRASVRAGGRLEVPRVGPGQMNRTEADQVLLRADGHTLAPVEENDTALIYDLPRGTRRVLFLYDSRGLHHHTNASVERHWRIGPDCVRLNGQPLPLAFCDTEADIPAPFLRTYTATFVLEPDSPLWLRLRHTGNGFLYLNGHCLGRCYEAGPQTEYYLPECWLRTDGENTITVRLMPSERGADIQEMALVQ